MCKKNIKTIEKPIYNKFADAVNDCFDYNMTFGNINNNAPNL